ncbi:hypothetical protein PHAVU_009G007800 [Phaseolus vulgaris]|uniref:Uncharacterized protein n=1 Tax=Phaseolus vulgaris TaxID=3885 RepID=V7AUS1_PHAVU|nr:hypothetical protein PHAVU_009G007800g [Phaseolus vulgaris]ESW07971.1 hypothetical protein PHAVU_009G007800g [Phaseolus vulgaris]
MQAVITAIDLLGNAVINAAESGSPFPLKRRDRLLAYSLALMGRDDEDGFADYACSTLVSVEPKLTVETRNHVMEVCGFHLIMFNSIF